MQGGTVDDIFFVITQYHLTMFNFIIANNQLKVEMKLVWSFLVGAAFSQMSMDKPETTTVSKIQKGL